MYVNRQSTFYLFVDDFVLSLSNCLSVCLSVSLSVCLPVCLSVCLFVWSFADPDGAVIMMVMTHDNASTGCIGSEKAEELQALVHTESMST